MPTHTIILAHGVLGFGHYFGLPLPIDSPIAYFNGVARHLKKRVDQVLEPQVSPIGHIADRAKTLADIIRQQPPGRIDVIAHSMGGLDARFALAHMPDVAARVTALVTIGTPHKGSPVADAVFDHTHALTRAIPEFIKNQAGALEDLTTTAAKKFNDTTSDAPGVRYYNIAGDARKGAPSLFYPLATVLETSNPGINDGLVLKSSALYDGHTHLEDWPVDHAGEIGWGTEEPFPIFDILPFTTSAHLKRYDALLTLLLSLPGRL
ncbi:hypothetical protein H8L32_15550 [Undibacterium sp. CY18W]|uniref:GPI inositol-deacylase PGAP1-like alpha/beta domain-containing protein n=1 Tax=Undibacterium hunanense TaxID=2762292 RepID=A0ABR6ZSQ8_9BURK|nr:hypothetical protein [Undibacterium hunanense]MBC3918905.1 hypothetical protein [Undibacterium hunanense]